VKGGLLFSGARLHRHALFFPGLKNFRNRKANSRNIENETAKTKMVSDDMWTALSPKKIATPLSYHGIAASRFVVFSIVGFFDLDRKAVPAALLARLNRAAKNLKFSVGI
jgi:hypothetical protein